MGKGLIDPGPRLGGFVADAASVGFGRKLRPPRLQFGRESLGMRLRRRSSLMVLLVLNLDRLQVLSQRIGLKSVSHARDVLEGELATDLF